MKTPAIALVAALGVSAAALSAEDDMTADAIVNGVHGYMPDNYVVPKEPEVRERLEWLKDQKLALMMHFGMYSQMGIFESWALSDADAHWSRVQINWTDGEEALEKAMRDALPFAEFTNDFMHAAEYMHTCCEKQGIPDAAKEYKTCRAIVLRHGAGSAVDRIKRLYAKELESSEEASSALNYLDKRRENMRYGWLRKNGYYISSCHIEAAVRILVARRCKQAGMHWRLHNAACVCAIIAKQRSAA